MKGKPKQAVTRGGLHPGADATAPGGMSMANLRLELAEEHGVKMEESRTLSWPALINRVANERLARERETGTPVFADERGPEGYEPGDLVDVVPDEEIGSDDEDVLSVEEMFPSDEDDDDFDDLDDLSEFDDSDEAIMGRNIREITAANQALPPQNRGPWAEGPGKKDGTSDLDLPQPEDDEPDVFDPETLFAEMHEAYDAAQDALPPPLFLGIPGIKDYVFDGHAGAGPSASERWMHCTMSLSLSRTFLETLSPNQQHTYAQSNTAARQGTTAHAVGEAKANHMLGRLEAEALASTLAELAIEPDEGEAYDDEMDEYVNEYVDLIKSYADERGAEHVLIESRVEAAIPLSDLHEGEVYIIRGSADVIALPTDEDPTLVVGDLKYGEGIHVDAEANSQAMIYALGALGLLTDDEGNLIVDIDKVVLIIAQPRLGGIKMWETTLDDLFDWRDEVLSPALTAALYGQNEGATFSPSTSACQFCPARGACPALTEQRYAEAAEAFDVIIEAEHEGAEFPETGTLSDEKLGALLSQITGLIDIHKDLKAEAQRRLHRGTPVPGYQLVNYTPPRKWKGIAEQKIGGAHVKGLTLAECQSLYKPQTLVTPKQATVILGEKAGVIAALYDTPDKLPVVAPEGDRRSKWEGKPPEAMFPDLDDSAGNGATHTAEEMFPDED